MAEHELRTLMNCLFTMPTHKIGDILWAAAVARHWSNENGGAVVDFMIAQSSSPIIALLQAQHYVGRVFSAPSVPLGYDVVKDASYPTFPDLPLPLYIAKNTGITMPEKCEPWMFPREHFTEPNRPYLAYNFNSLQPDRKRDFIEALRKKLPDVPFVRMSDYDWHVSGTIARDASWFVGCRCSNFVLAHAVGCPRMIVFEPEEGRRNPVFASPWAPETLVDTPEAAEAIIRNNHA